MSKAKQPKRAPATKQPVSDHDRIFEAAWTQTINYVDGETLRAGISKEDTAALYRELASECRDRANQLDAEAIRDIEEMNEDGADT